MCSGERLICAIGSLCHGATANSVVSGSGGGGKFVVLRLTVDADTIALGMLLALMMGVIGLIVASIVNIFLGSPALMFAISVIGVLVFAGLTAFDTQNIKNTYLQLRSAGGEAEAGRAAIIGALSLYLNFINMFMLLLQLFGQRE